MNLVKCVNYDFVAVTSKDQRSIFPPYPDSECHDLEYTFNGEKRGEGDIQKPQRILKDLVLTVMLQ